MTILRLLLLLCVFNYTFAASSGSRTDNVFDGTLPPLNYINGERTFEAIKFNPEDSTHRAWGMQIDADAKGGNYYAPTLMKERNSLDRLAGIPGYTGFFHSSSNPFLGEYVALERGNPVGVFSIGIPSRFFAGTNLDKASEILGLGNGDSTERRPDVAKAYIPLRPETSRYLEDQMKAAVEETAHEDALQSHGIFLFYVLESFRGKGMGTALVALAKQLTDCLVGQRFWIPQFNPDTKSFTDMLTPPFGGLRSDIARDNFSSLGAHLAIPDPSTIILEKTDSDAKFGWVVIFPKDDSLAPPSNRKIAETAIAMEKAHRAVAAGGTGAASTAVTSGGAGAL